MVLCKHSTAYAGEGGGGGGGWYPYLGAVLG